MTAHNPPTQQNPSVSNPSDATKVGLPCASGKDISGAGVDDAQSQFTNVVTAAREAMTALVEARHYIHLEAPHAPTERELRRVADMVSQALERADV